MLEPEVLELYLPLCKGKQLLVVIDTLSLDLRLRDRHGQCLVLRKEIKSKVCAASTRCFGLAEVGVGRNLDADIGQAARIEVVQCLAILALLF